MHVGHAVDCNNTYVTFMSLQLMSARKDSHMSQFLYFPSTTTDIYIYQLQGWKKSSSCEGTNVWRSNKRMSRSNVILLQFSLSVNILLSVHFVKCLMLMLVTVHFGRNYTHFRNYSRLSILKQTRQRYDYEYQFT